MANKRHNDYASPNKREIKQKLRSVENTKGQDFVPKSRLLEETEGGDFVLEGNMLVDKLIDATHYKSV